MASGMVPIRLIRDKECTADEVMVYLAASVLGGSRLDVCAVADLARLTELQAQMALFKLLASGDIEITGGYLRLGPMGGGSR